MAAPAAIPGQFTQKLPESAVLAVGGQTVRLGSQSPAGAAFCQAESWRCEERTALPAVAYWEASGVGG